MMNEIVLDQNHTIVEALKKLNTLRNISRLILFVTDQNCAVIGSLTDGDIRRNLAKDENLSQKVGDICNKDFVFLQHDDQAFDLKKYREKNLKILPVLNTERKIVDVIDLDKILAKLPLECMIMAGGRGKRLSPLTDKTPKPMLMLGEKPIIEHNIDRLISFGIKKIYISVKYLGEQIVDYFGDGSSKGIDIEYVWEEKSLGTAGALALVEKFETDHILLMNSDLFTNVDLYSLYVKFLREDAEMAVASTEYIVDIPYAVFETDEALVKGFIEKPRKIYQSNAGIYILKKSLISRIPYNDFFDITDLMQNVIESKEKLVFDPIRGYWVDIGKPIDYKQAQDFIKHFD